jgi:hypothetical protein
MIPWSVGNPNQIVTAILPLCELTDSLKLVWLLLLTADLEPDSSFNQLTSQTEIADTLD